MIHTLQAVRHAKIETPRAGCHQGCKQEEVQLDNAANAVPWLGVLDNLMDLLPVVGVVHVESDAVPMVCLNCSMKCLVGYKSDILAMQYEYIELCPVEIVMNL